MPWSLLLLHGVEAWSASNRTIGRRGMHKTGDCKTNTKPPRSTYSCPGKHSAKVFLGCLLSTCPWSCSLLWEAMNSVYPMTHRKHAHSADVAIHLWSVGTRTRRLSGLTTAALRLVGLLLVLGTRSLLLLKIGTLAHLSLTTHRRSSHRQRN